MSLGLHHQRTLERRRRRWRLVKWLLAVAAIAALGAVSYQAGSEFAKREVSRLRQEVDELSTEAASLRDENLKLQVQAEAAQRRSAEWQRRFETEVPKGRSGELLALVETQIEKGADPRRIAFMIEAAAKKQSCDGKPATRRFLVRTPIYAGANDSVSFAKNTVTVTGEGESATDASGRPEAWFDPAKPVNLQFVEPGGSRSEVAGLLPLYHSVVRGNSEYRFTIVAAEQRGFVNVTAERCAFP